MHENLPGAPCPVQMSEHSSLPLMGPVSATPTFGRLLNPDQRGNKPYCDYWICKTQHTEGLQCVERKSEKEQGLVP